MVWTRTRPILEEDIALTNISLDCIGQASTWLKLAGTIEEKGRDEDVLAEKSLKEVKYHFRHSKEWIIRLGDGTDESHKRTQNTIDDLYPLTGEMFEIDLVVRTLMKENILPDITKLKTSWETIVGSIIEEATLTIPENVVFTAMGSRQGNHSEQLGHILAEIQIVARSFPEAKW